MADYVVMQENDLSLMRLALRQAVRGLGRTSPNPCVGAIVVKDGKVIGQGYHKKAGTAHAEVNALQDAGPPAAGGTLYVTLEPCNHTGRTPPCTEAILKAGIARVVIGSLDPNPTVTGGGADHLKKRGLAVTSDILEVECDNLIRPFVKLATTGMPWVVMKAGMSLDGKIAYQRGCSGTITSARSHAFVHELRDRLDAILIGIETALIDNPSLTTRLPGGRGRDPLRVILDSHLRLPLAAKVIQQKSDGATWVFCANGQDPVKINEYLRYGVTVKEVPLTAEGKLNLTHVFRTLGEAGIMTVLVEGGGAIHGAVLAQGLVDEVYLFVSPFFIGGEGVPLITGYAASNRQECLSFNKITTHQLGNDLLIKGTFQEDFSLIDQGDGQLYL